MTNLIESEESVCTISREPPNSTSITPVISLLANSKTCGLALLVDKLVLDNRTSATQRLINVLINRFHHNSVIIKATADDDPIGFISNMIEAATQLAQAEGQTRSCIDLAARLFIRSIREFEIDQTNFSSLEHNWKEFAYHYYRQKLRESKNL